ncbi:MAG: hypothetical protein II956_16010 [Bacteroidales bacterium]|nr:hypothetical protein [Bacteroidales bacterium]
MNEIETLMNGQDSITQAGIQMLAEPLGKRKLKWQIITLQIPFDIKATIDSTNSVEVTKISHYRKPFETTAHKTNERIIGITLHSDFEEALNESTIQLSIDNEEILPESFDCSLITAKKDVGFYKNMYRLNERANGSLIKGTYVGGGLLPDALKWLETHPNAKRGANDGEYYYTVKLYLWSVQKTLAQNNKGL